MIGKILTLLVLIFYLNVPAQEIWTLERCIEYAKTHNLSIKQQYLRYGLEQENYRQSKGRLYPAVTANASHAYNYGQTIDIFTNQFAQTQVQTNNFYVSGSVTLFQGFQLLNQVRRSYFDMLAAEADVEAMEQDVVLNLITAYLQALYYLDMKDLAQRQVDISEVQLTRTSQMHQLGTGDMLMLLNAQARLSSDQYQLSQYNQQFEMALLNLALMLDLQDYNITISKPHVEPALQKFEISFDSVRVAAFSRNPLIRAAQYRVLSAQKSLQIARGAFSPIVTIGVSAGTGYSSASKELTGIEYAGLDTVGITTANPPEYVLMPVFHYTYTTIPFSDQLEKNLNRVIGFHLSVPLFTGLQNHSRVRQAKINLEMARVNKQQTLQQVEKLLFQYYMELQSAYERYQVSLKNVLAWESTYTVAEKKFAIGQIDQLQFYDTRQNFYRAEIEMLQAKYEFLFRLKVLEYLMGKHITL